MSEILSTECLDKIRQLRRTLHRYPELSDGESNTANLIKSFLLQQDPDRIMEGLGGHGVAAVYEGGDEGPTLLFRADLDALPIHEVNTFPHRSLKPGVAHKCGHDGHMAILSGLSAIFKEKRPTKGRIILLFQPAEETGQGAERVINDPQFQSIKPDYVFALHNLPGYEQNLIVTRQGPFAAASKGMIIRLQGKSSHAAHPEQGNSPVRMMTRLIDELMEVPKQHASLFKDFVLLTIIHARLGEVAFGTNPGKAEVMATLRTYLDEDMQILNEKSLKIAEKLAAEYHIDINVDYTEAFPATINDATAAQIVEHAIEKTGASSYVIEEPFRWSEDFGQFTGIAPGALFGIGSGKDHPSLHNHDYDFPDEILHTGIRMFYHIADQIVTLR